ncbi:PleD family two-component system response regulator [Patescibacteria group bacterium]
MKKGKSKILIVDDDTQTREIYADVFKNKGFEVHEASDGLEGLDIASSKTPDIIFTGIIMPRMDGFALMESLKKNVATSNIPVVISSHMGREVDQQKAIKMGAKAFIVRDMTPPNDVVEKIMAILGGVQEYRIEFNHETPDAQKLMQYLNLNKSYQCPKCGKDYILRLELANDKDSTFQVEAICPECKQN